MADVFLSYSSKDRAAAQRVQEALTTRGIDVFWDQETPPGQDWDTWIRTKLSTCKVAIVLWSRESVKSDNVRHEALVARKANKLIPAIVDPVSPEDLPMGLYMVQTINLADWRNPDSTGMERLIAEVEARVGRRTPGVTKAKTAEPQRKINWVAVAVGVVLVAGATGLMQWIYSPKTTPVSSEFASLACSNGLPRLSSGECPALGAPATAVCLDESTPVDGVCANGNRPIPPAPELGGGVTPAGDGFARRLTGSWHWEGQACENGTTVSISGGELVFETEGQLQFVHRIESDTPQETRTTVVAPETDAGQSYVLTPEYVATSASRNFNLVVSTGADAHVWYPCPE